MGLCVDLHVLARCSCCGAVIVGGLGLRVPGLEPHLGVTTVGCNSLITGNVRDDAKYEGVLGLLFDFRVLSRAFKFNRVSQCNAKI